MATEPTATQIMLALGELTGEATLNVACNGQWYVSARLEECKNGMLIGCSEYRPDPVEAVKAYWQRATSGCPLRINSAPPKYVRWSGFMFKEITREEAHGN